MSNFIQAIKKISTEKLIREFADISIEMYKKDNFLCNLIVPNIKRYDGKKVFTQLSPWDIHRIQYHSIFNSNDYRNSNKEYPIGQIVHLYRKFEEDDSRTEYLKDAEWHDVNKYIFGMISEQALYQDKSWITSNFNRNYHILVGSNNIVRKLTIGLNEIINEKFGWSVNEYISIQLFVCVLCGFGCEPLALLKKNNANKKNTVLTKSNVERFIKYYSCNYKDVRASNLQMNIFYSKPFIHTDNTKAYVLSNYYLVLWMISNSIYWLIRDYYKELDSNEFVNAFGIMFEDYLKELAAKFLLPGKWQVIEKSKTKSADFIFDFEDAVLVVEQKSSLMHLSVKQQNPDLAAFNDFYNKVVCKAYKQLKTTSEELKLSKPIIKIILLYENIGNTGLFEASFPYIFSSNENYFIMTIHELEIMFYLWSTDKYKCRNLLRIMLTERKDKIISKYYITEIYKEMGLYSQDIKVYEIDYYKLAFENLENELNKLKVVGDEIIWED